MTLNNNLHKAFCQMAPKVPLIIIYVNEQYAVTALWACWRSARALILKRYWWPRAQREKNLFKSVFLRCSLRWCDIAFGICASCIEMLREFWKTCVSANTQIWRRRRGNLHEPQQNLHQTQDAYVTNQSARTARDGLRSCFPGPCVYAKVFT